MDTLKNANTAALIIGAVGVIAGLYGWITGSSFQSYFLNLVIGISLCGTAWFNLREWKRKNRE